MSAPSSSSSSSVSLLFTCVVFVVVVCTELSCSWPLGGAALYECSCPECQRVRFNCRNTDYSCNCNNCSCYANNQPELKDAQALIGKLLRRASAIKNRRHRSRVPRPHRRPRAWPPRPPKTHRRRGGGHDKASSMDDQDENRTRRHPRRPEVDSEHQIGIS